LLAGEKGNAPRVTLHKHSTLGLNLDLRAAKSATSHLSCGTNYSYDVVPSIMQAVAAILYFYG
jgi:hypothetical protein